MSDDIKSFDEFFKGEWFDNMMVQNGYDKSKPITPCVFCDKSKIKAATIEMLEHDGIDFMCFTPMNPIIAGHLLIVPVGHVGDSSGDYKITGAGFALAAKVADKYKYKHYNLISNKGALADQTVFHLHIHIIPRGKDDDTITIWNKNEL